MGKGDKRQAAQRSDGGKCKSAYSCVRAYGGSLIAPSADVCVCGIPSFLR